MPQVTRRPWATAVTIDNTTPGRIVFESDRDGNSDIYAINPDGTDVTRLTTSESVDTRPSLSPDGNRIAWQSAGQVWLMNSDGSNKQALTSLGSNNAPTFSPDGTKIAFESDRTGDFEIWVMSADGTDQTNLTNTPLGDDVGPTWSPDGAKLAFDSSRTDDRDIFVMNADGTEQGNLTASGGLDADPDWSPDGSRLLFVSARTGPTSVWSMNVDGTDPVDLTSSGNFDADPAWSPDGNHIVFTRELTGGLTFNLWTARADGTAQLPITGAVSTQRNSFADWGSRASETVVTLEPVADTYVRASDAETAHGTETTFDVHAGANIYCDRGPGPSYGLLRFDLSSLPAGVQVNDARLELTVAGGFAQDGDPSHYAIRLNSNDWGESVTWNTRPGDGILPGPVGPPFGEPTINGVPLSTSLDVLGVGNAFNNNCDANSGGPAVRTFTAPGDRARSFANAVAAGAGDGSLSLQIWSQACGTPTTVVCQNGQLQQAYYLRYYSREARPRAAPEARRQLHVHRRRDLVHGHARTTHGRTRAGRPRGRATVGAPRAAEHDRVRTARRHSAGRHAARRHTPRRHAARGHPAGRHESRPPEPARRAANACRSRRCRSSATAAGRPSSSARGSTTALSRTSASATCSR